MRDDFNNDGSVDSDDLELIQSAVESNSDNDKFDLNDNGTVDITDVGLFASRNNIKNSEEGDELNKILAGLGLVGVSLMIWRAK